jgi:hypothetical protein
MALFKRIALSIMAASTVAALTLAAAAPAVAQAQGSSLYTFGFLDIGRVCLTQASSLNQATAWLEPRRPFSVYFGACFFVLEMSNGRAHPAPPHPKSD